MFICQNLERTHTSLGWGRESRAIPARHGNPLSPRRNHLPTRALTRRDTEESQSDGAERVIPESGRYAPHGPFHRTFWKRQNPGDTQQHAVTGGCGGTDCTWAGEVSGHLSVLCLDFEILLKQLLA